MKAELDASLVRDFPLLYRGRSIHHEYLDKENKLFGFECGNGWYHLLRHLSRRLERLISKQMDRSGVVDGLPHAVQVKEKYGTLRFYMSSETEAMSKAISQAEVESETTCEECGRPGRIYSGGWVVVRCEEHAP